MLLRLINGIDPLRVRGRMLDDFFPDWLGGFREIGGCPQPIERSQPAMNILEDDENLYVELELPGMKMEDLKVDVTGDQLTIKGVLGDADKDQTRWHHRERSVGAFSRIIRLPAEVDADKGKAELKNGLLTITLPWAASVRPKKIEVTEVTA